MSTYYFLKLGIASFLYIFVTSKQSYRDYDLELSAGGKALILSQWIDFKKVSKNIKEHEIYLRLTLESVVILPGDLTSKVGFIL